MALLAGCKAEELGSYLGVGDETPPVAEGTPPPRRAPIATPEPAPKATPLAMAAHLKRNLTFDIVRGRAIGQVYEGKTKVAVVTFLAALAIKPDDPVVKLWLDVINEALLTKRRSQLSRAPEGALGAPGFDGLRPPAPELPRPAVPAPSATPDPALMF